MNSNQSTQAIARRVKEARNALGLSQEDLGEKVGLSKVGYGEYERGNRLFDTEQLFRLARVLGRPVEYFLGLDMGLTGREERVLAIFRLAEEAGYGDLIIGLLHASVAQLLTRPGQVGEPVSDKP